MSENLFNHFATLLFVTLLLVAGCKDNGGAPSGSSGDSTKVISSSSGKSDLEQQTATGSKSVSTDSSDTEIVRSTAEDLPITNPKSTGPELVSFDDLKLGMQPDAKFRPVMLTVNDGRVKELFGKRVIVAGYMDPTDSMTGVKEFILLRNLECKFGPGGQADHLVRIYMADSETTSFTDKIVYVEGKLKLNPYPADPQQPSTYSIYDMVDSTVSTRRPAR